MGAKTALLAFAEGDIEAALRAPGPRDDAQTIAVVRALFPEHTVTPTRQRTVLTHEMAIDAAAVRLAGFDVTDPTRAEQAARLALREQAAENPFVGRFFRGRGVLRSQPPLRRQLSGAVMPRRTGVGDYTHLIPRLFNVMRRLVAAHVGPPRRIGVAGEWAVWLCGPRYWVSTSVSASDLCDWGRRIAHAMASKWRRWRSNALA